MGTSLVAGWRDGGQGLLNFAVRENRTEELGGRAAGRYEQERLGGRAQGLWPDLAVEDGRDGPRTASYELLQVRVRLALEVKVQRKQHPELVLIVSSLPLRLMGDRRELTPHLIGAEAVPPVFWGQLFFEVQSPAGEETGSMTAYTEQPP
jgi:hypothetical protein